MTILHILDPVKTFVNGCFEGKEPWIIVTITTITVLHVVAIYNFLHDDETPLEKGKKAVFRIVKKIPAIRDRIDKEMANYSEVFSKESESRLRGIPIVAELPKSGFTESEILERVNQCVHLGQYDWKHGMVSGAVYRNDETVQHLMGQIYKLASYTNPLHADIFPGICKLEAEIVRISCGLFNGDQHSAGTMTSGGTESIVLACKAFRDYAKETKGIKKPEIVVPVTAHVAFNKAGHFLNIKIRSVPVDPTTFTVNMAGMKRAITKNTILLVGSTPNFPYGTMDDIKAISELGEKYDIPVHVDACLGGFLICFMEKAGIKIPPFDFRLPGVKSISADTHKYGYAPKGSSVVLYRHEKLRHYQYTITTDWPGGIYGSPTVSGSRAGGVIATCWAAMMHFGYDGYVEATKQVIHVARHIEQELRKIEGIFIFGKPATSVIALGSRDFDIYHLAKKLSARGWNINILQFPKGIHLCVTHIHTKPGIAEDFLKAVKFDVEEILKNPQLPSDGMLAMYGTSQTISDRSIVGDIAKHYLDAMYHLPK